MASEFAGQGGGFGATTVNSAGGAVSDLFSGQATRTSDYAQAAGLDIEASGTRINAQALRLQGTGDLAEATEYDLAGGLATANEQFTAQSTALQMAQQARTTTQSLGSTRAAVAGSGFTMSGSTLDILRDSASQGAIAKATLGQQGLITEAGYQEEAESYSTMSTAARYAASQEEDMANQTDTIAGQQDQLAVQEQQAGDTAERNSYITAGIKGAAAIASLA